MSLIRVGYFEGFKGSNALLLAADHAGLAALAHWVRALATRTGSQPLDQCPGVQLHRNLQVVAEVASSDVGLGAHAGGTLVWRRTSGGWGEVAEQLTALGNELSGHQYLEGTADVVVPIASVGEYSDSWWREHAG